LSSKLKGWLVESVAILPNVIVAVLVMVAFVFIAKVAGNILRRVLNRTSDNPTVTRLIENFVRLLILFFGLFTALGILNLEKTVASLLAGAGVIGLAIGFAFQEIAANFFSGILIALRKPYKPGDIVQIDNHVGTVNDLTLRTTNIITADGLEILIPTKDMFTKAVTNYTSTPLRRVEIAVGVSYDGDLTKVEQVVKTALDKVVGRLKDRPVEFYFNSFGDSSINGKAYFWIEFPGDNYWPRANHEAVMAIKAAFDANGLSMPFPTRTLEIHTQDMQLANVKLGPQPTN
jgi:small conductance mechanosensitive channel